MSVSLPDDVGALPREQKIDMCRRLLDEFGAQRVTLLGDELHHSCVLPLGMHAHGDRNPSASINVEKLVFSCFVCGGGSLLWWIATCRETSTHEARGWLDNATGVGGTNLNSLLHYFDTIYHPSKDHQELVPHYAEAVLRPWAYHHPYMTEMRGIPLETLKHFRVGWDPEKDRIVIPHFWKGKLVGWSTRRLINDGSPKYKHSPQFPKKVTLYNYEPRRAAVVVESPMSVLARYHQCPVMEATFGASVTSGQIRLLAQHPRVTLFFDNDAAGWNATMEVGESLINYTDVGVVQNPWSADPADLSDDDFGLLMSNVVPFGVWTPPIYIESYKRGE